MTSKKKTPEELLSEFDNLGASEEPPAPAAKTASTTASKPAASKAGADPLAELENLAHERPKSRPHTPRVGAASAAAASSPKKPTDATIRKSTDSARSFRTGMTVVEDAARDKEKEAPQASPESAAGGGWWGTLSGFATAATKQAEALAKEIQKNEEAQRWAEQVRGNVGALRTYGGELRSKALPTFATLLDTLAPPISSHERLQIHITHDLVGYPALDPLIYQTFSRVMAQVEGGELIVIQKGQESAQRRGSDAGYVGSAASGWSDGPWWKSVAEKRDVGSVKGIVEGTKLARVSAEAHASEFFSSRGGVEEAAKKAAVQTADESNPTRRSDIFLAVQAINHTQPAELFGESGGSKTRDSSGEGVADPPASSEELMSFAVFLHDPVHGITFNSVSQGLPQQWISWVDNLAPWPDAPAGHLPDDVRDIVEAGGLDPREWVAEWVEEVLVLALGTVAQRYVAKRMGVGEGGFAKGKAKEAMVDQGAGEAARAL